jgi:membrane protein DedA with SNARE-associated domain
VSDVLHFVSRHGYAAIALVVFLEAVGLPIPAALALLAGGAAIALHQMRADVFLLTATLAMLLGDVLLFVLGRYTGWTLLAVLCRLASNPESCILRSAESFYKRGRTTLVLAKFIPGINTMAPPLAGSMKMRPAQFLALDLAGCLLYIFAYAGVGFVFSGVVEMLANTFHRFSSGVTWVVALGIIAWAAYHAYLYWKHRVYRVVPRVQASELAAKLGSAEEAAHLVIADVRSHGYYDPGASRIRGSIRIEPNRLRDVLNDLPRDKEIYLYCT